MIERRCEVSNSELAEIERAHSRLSQRPCNFFNSWELSRHVCKDVNNNRCLQRFQVFCSCLLSWSYNQCVHLTKSISAILQCCTLLQIRNCTVCVCKCRKRYCPAEIYSEGWEIWSCHVSPICTFCRSSFEPSCCTAKGCQGCCNCQEGGCTHSWKEEVEWGSQGKAKEDCDRERRCRKICFKEGTRRWEISLRKRKSSCETHFAAMYLLMHSI